MFLKATSLAIALKITAANISLAMSVLKNQQLKVKIIARQFPATFAR